MKSTIKNQCSPVCTVDYEQLYARLEVQGDESDQLSLRQIDEIEQTPVPIINEKLAEQGIDVDSIIFSVRQQVERHAFVNAAASDNDSTGDALADEIESMNIIDINEHLRKRNIDAHPIISNVQTLVENNQSSGKLKPLIPVAIAATIALCVVALNFYQPHLSGSKFMVTDSPSLSLENNYVVHRPPPGTDMGQINGYLNSSSLAAPSPGSGHTPAHNLIGDTVNSVNAFDSTVSGKPMPSSAALETSNCTSDQGLSDCHLTTSSEPMVSVTEFPGYLAPDGSVSAMDSGSSSSGEPLQSPIANENTDPDTLTMDSGETLSTRVVQDGDILWNMVRDHYGIASMDIINILLYQNPHITDPDRLRIGDLVYFPLREHVPLKTDEKDSRVEPQQNESDLITQTPASIQPIDTMEVATRSAIMAARGFSDSENTAGRSAVFSGLLENPTVSGYFTGDDENDYRNRPQKQDYR